MKYIANPVKVDAYKITSVKTQQLDGIKDFDGEVTLDNGETKKLESGMMARYVPKEDDYYVVQEDGYVYLNPKEVFEKKYSPAVNSTGPLEGFSYMDGTIA